VCEQSIAEFNSVNDQLQSSTAVVHTCTSAAHDRLRCSHKDIAVACESVPQGVSACLLLALTSRPPWLHFFLQVLYLYDNQLTSIASIGSNRLLTHLYIQNNRSVAAGAESSRYRTVRWNQPAAHSLQQTMFCSQLPAHSA
jgi:ABC-type protease/lipase transport system fused ATPase/permease subunit